ncbi:NAD(P)/FAD-dependent oxidoreductase [Rhizobium mongolense]|uniref:NAD(P)/FAD-dependent oxidoreductase n=1 Tax=Rhizobium mongolense TaxID=57676 RepID=UPI003558CD9E
MSEGDTFDIAVIGGGIVGSAIAWFCADAGAKVVLIERSEPGAGGATSVSGGILRVFDRDVHVARCAKHGMSIFKNWGKYGMPGSAGYVPCGFVYLLNDHDVIAARSLAEQLDSRAYPVKFIEKNAIRSLFGWLKEGEWAGAVLEAKGGYGEPRRTAESLSNAAYLRGVIACTNETVQSVQPDPVGVRIVTNKRILFGGKAVLSAGAATDAVLIKSGIILRDDQRIRPRAIGVPTLVSNNGGMPISHTVVDELNVTYVRPLSSGAYMVGANLDRWVTDPHEVIQSTSDQAEDAHMRGAKIAQCLDATTVADGVCGIDGYTISGRPVVGVVPGFKELFIAAGFSGRGYKTAPFVAAVIAENLVGPPQSAVLREIVKHGLGEYAQAPALN